MVKRNPATLCLATARHFDFGAKVIDARDGQDPSMGVKEPEPWVTMPDALWSAALREMDPLPPPVDDTHLKRLAESRSVNDVPRSLVEAAIEYLSEDLVCDHNVGICMCSTAAVVDELRLALDGKLTCHTCGGEGFTWNENRHRAECQKLATHHGYKDWKEAADVLGDSPGYATCPECEGSGHVRMTGVGT